MQAHTDTNLLPNLSRPTRDLRELRSPYTFARGITVQHCDSVLERKGIVTGPVWVADIFLRSWEAEGRRPVVQLPFIHELRSDVVP